MKCFRPRCDQVQGTLDWRHRRCTVEALGRVRRGGHDAILNAGPWPRLGCRPRVSVGGILRPPVCWLTGHTRAVELALAGGRETDGHFCAGQSATERPARRHPARPKRQAAGGRSSLLHRAPPPAAHHHLRRSACAPGRAARASPSRIPSQHRRSDARQPPRRSPHAPPARGGLAQAPRAAPASRCAAAYSFSSARTRACAFVTLMFSSAARVTISLRLREETLCATSAAYLRFCIMRTSRSFTLLTTKR